MLLKNKPVVFLLYPFLLFLFCGQSYALFDSTSESLLLPPSPRLPTLPELINRRIEPVKLDLQTHDGDDEDVLEPRPNKRRKLTGLERNSSSSSSPSKTAASSTSQVDDQQKLDELSPISEHTSISSTSSTSIVQEPTTLNDTDVNMVYWYDDTVMNAVLQAGFAQLGPVEGFILMPPLGPTPDQLENHLREELETNHHARTILVPYNIGNYHWVGLVIRINDRNDVTEILYIDSLRAEMPTNIIRALVNVYAEEGEEEEDIQQKIKQIRGLRQEDGSSCGALTLENLLLAAQNRLKKQSVNISETLSIRKKHILLLRTTRPDAPNLANALLRSSYTVIDIHEDSEVAEKEALILPDLQPEFDMESFLKEYNLEHHRFHFDLSNLNTQEALVEACWRALLDLSENYKKQGDTDNYIFTRINMGKLLVFSRIFPQQTYPEENQRIFLYHIIIRKLHSAAETTKGKTRVWTLIHSALFALDYLRRYPDTSHREELLADAYNDILRAITPDSTRTAYFIAAKIILEFNYQPPGTNRDEALKLAAAYIRQGWKVLERDTETPPKRNALVATHGIVERYARPGYIPKMRKRVACKRCTHYDVDKPKLPMAEELTEAALAVADESAYVPEPTEEELKRRYPDVDCVTTTRDEAIVRRILYYIDSGQKTFEEIAQCVGFGDHRRISEIAVANSRKCFDHFTDEQKDLLFRVYVAYYAEVQSKRLTWSAIAKAFKDKHHFKERKDGAVLRLIGAWSRVKIDDAEVRASDPAVIASVIKAYKDDKGTFVDLLDKQVSTVNYAKAFHILINNLLPEQIKPMDLGLQPGIAAKEKHRLIIAAFEKVLASGMRASERGVIQKILNELTSQGYHFITRPQVSRFLVKKGLIAKQA